MKYMKASTIVLTLLASGCSENNNQQTVVTQPAPVVDVAEKAVPAEPVAEIVAETRTSDTKDKWHTAREKSAKAWEATKDAGSSGWEATRETTADVWDATRDTTGDAWQATKDTSSELWDKTRSTSGDIWTTTKQESQKAWEATRSGTQKVADKIDENLSGDSTQTNQ